MFFMPYFKGYAVSNSFQGTKVTPKERTEANSKDNTTRSLEMCCDRHENHDPFSELSQQESRAYTNLVFSQIDEETTPPSEDSSGNR